MRHWKLSGQRLFTLWFGWGLPLVLAGALAISFTESWALGAAAAAVFLAWFYETGRTTCSRCAYHGTAKCGLPGLIAPLLTPKRSAESLSPERVRAHLYLDLWILLLLNGLCALQAWALPVSLIWSIGVWRIALGPKRHHGLLYRLRDAPLHGAATLRAMPITFTRAQAAVPTQNCVSNAPTLPLGERADSRLGASQDCSTLTHKGNRHE